MFQVKVYVQKKRAFLQYTDFSNIEFLMIIDSIAPTELTSQWLGVNKKYEKYR